MTGSEVETRSRLVKHLVELRESRQLGPLAELRRGLGRAPGTVPRMAPHVEEYMPADATPWVQDIHYLVASLFASHQADRAAPRGTYTLGHAFRALARKTESGSTQQRFLAMLDADSEDVHVHLRHAISLLKAKDIPVDYDQLLRDLRGWRRDDRRVQRTWARAYFGGQTHDDDGDEASSDNQQPGNIQS